MSGCHIFLVGFMGAGKTTVSRIVAERLGRPAADLDDMIERAAGMPVSEIFASRGEDAFRALETEALARLATEAPSVVACGGGVVVRPENRTLLAELGTVIYLQVTAGEAIARIGDVSTRPLLAGPGGLIAATSLLQARETLYRSVADLVIDTAGNTPDEVAGIVVAALEERL